KKLDPAKPVWLDVKKHRVVMVGQVCQRDAALELFACLRDTKEHEAILTVDVDAATVHAGLLASGAIAGSPVRFTPMYTPAEGTEIEITLAWKNEEGQRKTARAQDWILDAETDKPMAHPWVFAGSGFWEDEQSGKRHYMADSGDFICVSNFTTAMLDLPIESSQANNALMFQALTEAIPPLSTPVTLILTPKIEQPKDEQKPAAPESGEAQEPKPAEISKPEADPPVESDDKAESDAS
ncbi:MAG TPA: YdjY domain-containing protein, partial [Thermoguttaceae bacterium]|nr:YdjY domain-containing protein [Thermoguttaceae bacterium]